MDEEIDMENYSNQKKPFSIKGYGQTREKTELMEGVKL